MINPNELYTQEENNPMRKCHKTKQVPDTGEGKLPENKTAIKAISICPSEATYYLSWVKCSSKISKKVMVTQLFPKR